MGKFEGVLLYSDYDSTLYNTQHTVSLENRQAIDYFMGEGGRFSIATGRAHRTFTPQIAKEHLRFNAPVVLSNGAVLYDYQQEQCLEETHLPLLCVEHLETLCTHFPTLGLEAYHGEEVYVYRPNFVTDAHLNRVGVPYEVCPISHMPTPFTKVILQQEHTLLTQVQRYILSHWETEYEAIFSHHTLLELTAKGSTKGGMVLKSAQMLGIDRANLYCIGDNENDLPMLAVSAIPFAPENCAPSLRAWGAQLVPHCDHHAIAHVISQLDKRYPR